MNTKLVTDVAAAIFTSMAKEGFVLPEPMDNTPAKLEARCAAAIATSINLAKRFEKACENLEAESDIPFPETKTAKAPTFSKKK